jgi:hypothetical protein
VSDTTMKGAIAETAITARAVELGIVVLKPVVEGRRYDLVFDTGERLLRVQCKWGRCLGPVIVVRLLSCRTTPNGYVRTRYEPSEIDGVAVYCAAIKQCYYLPITEIAGRTEVRLRLAPTLNRQEAAINFAARYELGAIAQLGERVTGSHEVGGSNPPSSTSRPLA